MSAEAQKIEKKHPVILPSKGLLYEDATIEDGRVSVRALTTHDESVLFSPRGDPITKIGQMINGCLLDCPVSPDDLLLVDRFAVLLAIRTCSFGPEYVIDTRCRHCNAQFKHTVNIVNDLEEHFMDDPRVDDDGNEYDLEIVEPFTMTLPDCGDEITFRLLRGKDESEIARYSKRARMQNKNSSSDPTYVYRLARQLIGLNGEDFPGTPAKERYVKQLSARDSRALEIKTDEIEYGIDSTIFPECAQCGAINEMDLPLTIEFFRPTSV